MIQTPEIQLGSLNVDFSKVGSKLLEPQLVEKFCHILSRSVKHVLIHHKKYLVTPLLDGKVTD